ncbi:MAG: TrmH family RNA methyltransferase [Candidatus Cryptobacteroides sp.]
MPISNNEIKRVKSLQQKKFRDQLGLFTVEGEKMVSEALSSGFKVESVFYVSDIGQSAMERISALSSPSPALAVLHKPSDIRLNSPEVPSEGLYLALDGIRDPGNLGTIIRTADWFGIKTIYVSEDTVDVFNPKVVQATMGAIFRVKIHYVHLPSFCRSFRHAGGRIYGTFLNGSDIYATRLEDGDRLPVLMITGNESEGISEEVASEVTDRLFIPPYPGPVRTSESLNAAVATAVAVAEFRRRIRTNSH